MARPSQSDVDRYLRENGLAVSDRNRERVANYVETYGAWPEANPVERAESRTEHDTNVRRMVHAAMVERGLSPTPELVSQYAGFYEHYGHLPPALISREGEPVTAEPHDRGVLGFGADQALAFARGAAGLGSMGAELVGAGGVADVFGGWDQALAERQTAKQTWEARRVAEAETAGEALSAYWQHPAQIASAISGSLPATLAGGLLGRAVGGVSGVLLGHGAVAGGMEAGSMRAEGRGLPESISTGAVVGAGVAALGGAGRGLAKLLGAADLEEVLALGRRMPGTRIPAAALSEAAEEAAQEGWQAFVGNVGRGMPAAAGIGAAAVHGAIAGAGMALPGGALSEARNIAQRAVEREQEAEKKKAEAEEKKAAEKRKRTFQPEDREALTAAIGGRRAQYEGVDAEQFRFDRGAVMLEIADRLGTKDVPAELNRVVLSHLRNDGEDGMKLAIQAITREATRAQLRPKLDEQGQKILDSLSDRDLRGVWKEADAAGEARGLKPWQLRAENQAYEEDALRAKVDSLRPAPEAGVRTMTAAEADRLVDPDAGHLAQAGAMSVGQYVKRGTGEMSRQLKREIARLSRTGEKPPREQQVTLLASKAQLYALAHPQDELFGKIKKRSGELLPKTTPFDQSRGIGLEADPMPPQFIPEALTEHPWDDPKRRLHQFAAREDRKIGDELGHIVGRQEKADRRADQIFVLSNPSPPLWDELVTALDSKDPVRDALAAADRDIERRRMEGGMIGSGLDITDLAPPPPGFDSWRQLRLGLEMAADPVRARQPARTAFAGDPEVQAGGEAMVAAEVQARQRATYFRAQRDRRAEAEAAEGDFYAQQELEIEEETDELTAYFDSLPEEQARIRRALMAREDLALKQLAAGTATVAPPPKKFRSTDVKLPPRALTPYQQEQIGRIRNALTLHVRERLSRATPAERPFFQRQISMLTGPGALHPGFAQRLDHRLRRAEVLAPSPGRIFREIPNLATWMDHESVRDAVAETYRRSNRPHHLEVLSRMSNENFDSLLANMTEALGGWDFESMANAVRFVVRSQLFEEARLAARQVAVRKQAARIKREEIEAGRREPPVKRQEMREWVDPDPDSLLDTPSDPKHIPTVASVRAEADAEAEAARSEAGITEAMEVPPGLGGGIRGPHPVPMTTGWTDRGPLGDTEALGQRPLAPSVSTRGLPVKAEKDEMAESLAKVRARQGQPVVPPHITATPRGVRPRTDRREPTRPPAGGTLTEAPRQTDLESIPNTWPDDPLGRAAARSVGQYQQPSEGERTTAEANLAAADKPAGYAGVDPGTVQMDMTMLDSLVRAVGAVVKVDPAAGLTGRTEFFEKGGRRQIWLGAELFKPENAHALAATLAHEIWHAREFRAGGEQDSQLFRMLDDVAENWEGNLATAAKSRAVQAELASASREWRKNPPGYERMSPEQRSAYDAYRATPREQSADFFSAFLVNPEWARAHAPLAFDAVLAGMDEATWNAHNEIRSELAGDLDMHGKHVEAAFDLMRARAEETRQQHLDRKQAERREAFRNPASMLRGRVWHTIFRKFVDARQPLFELGKRAAALSVINNPDAVAMNNARNYSEDPVVASLAQVSDIINKAGLSEEHLNRRLQYRVAQKGVPISTEMLDPNNQYQGIPLKELPAGLQFIHTLNALNLTSDGATAAIGAQDANLSAGQVDALNRAADLLEAQLASYVPRLLEAGVLSRETAAALSAAEGSFPAFFTSVYMTGRATGQTIHKASSADDPGSFVQLAQDNMLFMEQLISTTRGKQSTLHALQGVAARLGESGPRQMLAGDVQYSTTAQAWEMTTEAAAANEGTELLSLRRNGKLEHYAVDPAIAAVYRQRKPPSYAPFLNSLLGIFNRGNLIWEPAWIVKNLVADMSRAFILDPEYSALGAGRFLSHLATSLPAAAQARHTAVERARMLEDPGVSETKKERIRRFNAAVNAGAVPTYSRADVAAAGFEPDDPRAVDVGLLFDDPRLSKTPKGYASRLVEAVDAVFNPVISISEALPKLSAYERDTAAGRAMDLERVRFIRETLGSPDYAIKGEWGWQMNALVRFFNSNVQGMRGDLKAIKANRTNSIIKLSMFALAPALLTELARVGAFGTGGGDDEEYSWYAKALRSTAPDERRAYMTIPLGFDEETQKGTVVRIPYAYTAVPLTDWIVGAFDRWEYGARDNPLHYAQEIVHFGRTVMGNIPGADGSMGPEATTIWQTFQLMSGKNPWIPFYQDHVFSDEEFEGMTPVEKGAKFFLEFVPDTFGFSMGGSAALRVSPWSHVAEPRDAHGMQAFVQDAQEFSGLERFFRQSDRGRMHERIRRGEQQRAERSRRDAENMRWLRREARAYGSPEEVDVGQVRALSRRYVGERAEPGATKQRKTLMVREAAQALVERTYPWMEGVWTGQVDLEPYVAAYGRETVRAALRAARSARALSADRQKLLSKRMGR